MPLIDLEYKQRLIERLEERNRQGRLFGKYQLNPGTGIPAYVSPEQMIDEAKRGTPLGNEILMAEYQFMKELERRRPR